LASALPYRPEPLKTARFLALTGAQLARSRLRSFPMATPSGTWLFPVVGGVIGLALGILVSVSTDVPFAPELGLVLGALVGWLSGRART
jgi:hypothetical protein